MEEDPSDRPSAAEAMERLRQVAQKTAEEDPFEDFDGCLEGVFQVDGRDEEQDTHKEDNEEEEDDLEKALKNISTAKDVEDFNNAMNRIFS